MSPSNKKKLNILRKKLDALDNQLLDLIKIRTKYVDSVINLKQFKKEIIDQKRIRKILSNINKKSKLRKIDPIITNRIWKNMI